MKDPQHACGFMILKITQPKILSDILVHEMVFLCLEYRANEQKVDKRSGISKFGHKSSLTNNKTPYRLMPSLIKKISKWIPAEWCVRSVEFK